MNKAGSKTANDVLFQAGLDLSTLQNLFECVNHQAQIIIGDGDTDTEHYGLILEAVAEKGIREADAAMARVSEGRRQAKKEDAAPVPPGAARDDEAGPSLQ